MLSPDSSSPSSSHAPLLSSHTKRLLSGKGLKIGLLAKDDVNIAHAIERDGYPEDEAASKEKLEERQRSAGSFFLGAYRADDNELLGFICATRCKEESLTHESMSSHVPGGPTLCIHSVAVGRKHRRQGIALVMLKAYVEHCAAFRSIRRLRLIAKAYLLALYARSGFTVLGVSSVQHGKDQWYEMGFDLDGAIPRCIPWSQVDAFARFPFEGNPAAVVFSQGLGDEKWMQDVAAEMNLSETCFVETMETSSSSDHSFLLRWFTPEAEVDLCGHATLACAQALWDSGRAPPKSPITFYTASGQLHCSRSEQGWIHMNFPREDAHTLAGLNESDLDILRSALGLSSTDILCVAKNRVDLLVEITPEAFESRLRPTSEILCTMARSNGILRHRGVIATCRGGLGIVPGGAEFQSRFFCPALGMLEDPVTGSAHCCLGPYWESKGLAQEGAEQIGWQASKRGGVVCLECPPGSGRVNLKGMACAVMTGLLPRPRGMYYAESTTHSQLL